MGGEDNSHKKHPFPLFILSRIHLFRANNVYMLAEGFQAPYAVSIHENLLFDLV